MNGRRRAARSERVLTLVLGGLLLLVVASAAWIGVRGFLAQQHLRAAQTAAAEVSSALAASNPGDAAAIASRVQDVSEELAAARGLTGDPVWTAAESLPWVGPQLTAVGEVTKALATIVESAGPLVDAMAGPEASALTVTQGAVQVSALAALREPAEVAAGAARRSAENLRAVDEDLLLPPVREAFLEAERVVEQVVPLTDAFARATSLLPKVLGADGPRSYLLLFQNNAEWRSLGGLVGSVALVTTDNGRFSLAAQGSGGGLGYYPDPPIPFSDEVLAIYGTRPGRFPANVTQLPDFALGAPLLREYWKQTYGQEADGAIAVDPVALSYVLGATGPVELPTGDVLTAENVVPLMLNEVYLRYADPEEQNRFFEAATAAVVSAITTRDVNPISLVSALGRAAAENRIFIWSARADEQALLDGTSLQGALPTTDEVATRFGVYVNDGTGSKMDYYMRLSTDAQWCSQDADGTGVAGLRVTLQSVAPADIAAYPVSITGGGNYGVTPGVARTVTYVYLPEGATPLTTSSSDGSGLGGGVHDGRLVYAWATDLNPGESVTLDVTVRTTLTEKLEVVKTATLGESTVGSSPACGG